MRSELKRLAAIAARVQLCTTHYTKLVCITCDVEWRGTDAEFWELGDLLKRLEPYWGDPRPSGQYCPTHDENLYCRTCADETSEPKIPGETLTEAEIERYTVLLALMHIKES